jgi:hypothetical protein
MTTAKGRNFYIFLETFHCLILDPSNSALFLDSSRSRTRSFVLCENVWLWRRRPTVGDAWFSRRRRLRKTQGRLSFVLVVWIDGRFFRRFGNGNSFTVRNWTESGWYIRIYEYYCPLLLLRDASTNRWHHTEVAVSCMITWLPPNHRKSKWHRMHFAMQSLRNICCTFTAAYVRGLRIVVVVGLASQIQMISLFHYRGDGLTLPCKRHFTANITKVICIINTFTRHQ